MAADSIVRARIPSDLKQEATDVLAHMGFSVSDAIRMLMVRIAREKAMPFEARVPNDVTLQAIAELSDGRSSRAADVTQLMAQLNADD